VGPPDHLFKLEKLTIEAYDKPERSGPPKATFKAMYNPTSMKQSHTIKWIKTMGKGEPTPTVKYDHTEHPNLELDLILDGTGVEQMGVLNLFGTTKTVKERVSDFLDTTYDYQGKIHQPHYLKVKWGLPEEFECRLSSFDIIYTSFDRDGTPLRAELKVSLIGDEDLERGLKKADPQSSDLTHSRTLRAGDTLPLLTREIYGSSTYYLDVARFNNMNAFRSVTPGQQVLFPPLETLLGGR